MQDRYTGDVGDFAKLALLRVIADHNTLGVLWYRVPDEGHNTDGKHDGYLARPSNYRALDPELFDLLRQVRARSPRTVRDLSPALPGASFVEEYVPSGVMSREEWFARSKDALRDKQTIFLDPDNGIASKKLARGSRKAVKAVFMPEVESLHRAGHSLVIYHHATRHQKGVTVSQQAEQLAQRLHQSGARTVLPVISRRGTVRIFLVTNVSTACHAAVARFAELWRDHVDYPVQEFIAASS
jgi:hypothetical protein